MDSKSRSTTPSAMKKWQLNQQKQLEHQRLADHKEEIKQKAEENKIKKDLQKKTLVVREVIQKQKNKTLQKYYRQLGEIETNFETIQKDEQDMLLKINKLRKLGASSQSRSENEKRGIIDNQLRVIKFEKNRQKFMKQVKIVRKTTKKMSRKDFKGLSPTTHSGKKLELISEIQLSTDSERSAGGSSVDSKASEVEEKRKSLSKLPPIPKQQPKISIPSIQQSLEPGPTEMKYVMERRSSFQGKQKQPQASDIDKGLTPKEGQLRIPQNKRYDSQSTLLAINDSKRKSCVPNRIHKRNFTMDNLELKPMLYQKSDLSEGSAQTLGNNLQHSRPIGTFYIEKKPIEIKFMKPVGSHQEYAIIQQSYLDMNVDDLQKCEIEPSPNFFTTIKKPQVEIRDLYNKAIQDYLYDKRRKKKQQMERMKPPLAKTTTKTSQVNLIQTLKEKLENNEGSNNQSEAGTRRSFTPSNREALKRHHTSKLLEFQDRQAHMKILDEIKASLKKVLKDNQKQIDLMNEDTAFYMECRDLMNEIFEEDLQRSKEGASSRRTAKNIKFGVSIDAGHKKVQSELIGTHGAEGSGILLKEKLLHSQQPSRDLTKSAKSGKVLRFQDQSPSVDKFSTSEKRKWLECQRTKGSFTKRTEALKAPESDDLIPLIYYDQGSKKTIVKFQASMRDKKKVLLLKELAEVREQRNKVAKVLEKVLKMYDYLSKERMEKQKVQTPRSLQRTDQKIQHLQELVKLCISRFNQVIKEKMKVLDDIFKLALPKQKNPLARISELAKINSNFLSSIREDENAYRSNISTVGLHGGDLNQRLGYLNLMQKSLNIFQQIIAKKVQESQAQKEKQILKRISPRNCIFPSSLESVIIVENLELERNYFSRSHGNLHSARQSFGTESSKVRQAPKSKMSRSLQYKRIGSILKQFI